MKKKGKMPVLLKAVLLCLALFALGFIVGNVASRLSEGISLKEHFPDDEKTAGITFLILQAVIVLGGMTAAGILFALTKKRADKWDGEDEDEIDAIESSLNIPVIMCSILSILDVILFSSACYFLNEQLPGWIVWPTIVFLVGIIGVSYINERAVMLEKKLNPEKKGSSLDLNFRKKWIASCDEAQKQIIWQSGYAAYVACNISCTVLWIVAFFVQMSLRCGIMPVLGVGIIWLINNLTYTLTCAKLENGK